jgi:hypothetical protein
MHADETDCNQGDAVRKTYLPLSAFICGWVRCFVFASIRVHSRFGLVLASGLQLHTQQKTG